MRKQVFRVLLPILGMIVVVAGCSTDQDDELTLLGEWVEEAPVENRTELYFHSVNRVTRTANGVSDEYFYRVVENSILLRPQDGNVEQVAVELFFRQISENSFQIENLYPSIPEEETTYMIFRRKDASNGGEEEDDEDEA